MCLGCCAYCGRCVSFGVVVVQVALLGAVSRCHCSVSAGESLSCGRILLRCTALVVLLRCSASLFCFVSVYASVSVSRFQLMVIVLGTSRG